MSEFDQGFGNVDDDRGNVIMHQFHNAMYAQYSDYNLEEEELKAKYNPYIIEALGLAANSSGMTNAATNKAMIALADAGKGQIPANYNGFFNALQGEASKTNLWQAVYETATETASDVTDGLQQTGTALINVGSAVVGVANYTKYFLWGGIAFALWAIYTNRDQVGKAIADKVTGK